MLKTTLSTLVWLILVSHCIAAPQVEQNIIVINRGESATISSKGLKGISIGSILVASIKNHRGDEVTVVGNGAGETTLELTHKDGSKRTFTIRINPPTIGYRAVAPATQRSKLPASTSQADIVDPKVKDNTTNADIVDPKAKDNTTNADQLTPIAPAEEPISRTTRARRVQFAIDFIYISENEAFPLLTSHHDDEGEAHSAHLHTEDTVRASRKLIVVPLTIRFMPTSRSTIAVTLPFIRRTDELRFSGQSVRSRSQGLGDIELTFDRTVNPGWEAWSANWGIGLRLPTGKSVHNLKTGESPLGTGNWEISGSAGVSKIFDPMVFRSNFLVTYAVPRTVNGVRFAPGWGHGFQTGIDYAVSDRWTVAQQLVYLRRQNVFLTSPIDAGTEIASQAYLSHSLFFQPKRQRHAYRLRFDVGLNNTASDVGINFGYQW